MTQIVRAFGKQLRFPDDMSKEDMEAHILEYEHQINDDYVEPSPTLTERAKEFSKEHLGVDFDAHNERLAQERKAFELENPDAITQEQIDLTEDRTFLESAKDTGLSLAQGGAMAIEGAAWLAKLTGLPTEGIQQKASEIADKLDSKKSPQSKMLSEYVMSQRGFVDTIKAAGSNPGFIAEMIAQSAALMIPGGLMAAGARGTGAIAMRLGAGQKLIAEAGMKAAVNAAAKKSIPLTAGVIRSAQLTARQKVLATLATGGAIVGEGLTSGGLVGADVEEFVKDQNINDLKENSPRFNEIILEGWSEAEAKDKLARELSTDSAMNAGTWTSLVSGATGAGRFLGQVATGGVGAGKREIAKNIAKETLDEMLQEPGEAFFEHKGKVAVDPSQTVDLPQAAALGAIGGFGQSSGMSIIGAATSRADRINDERTRLGLNKIGEAQNVDEAIAATQETVSQKPTDANDILRTDPSLAEIEKLTGLKPTDAIVEAETQAQVFLDDQAIQAQAVREDITAQRIVEEQALPKVVEPAPATKAVAEPETAIEAPQRTEIVLPDDTTLSAQWEIVDADTIQASIKEGIAQPRDRTRAISDIQIQGIASKPDYRRLSDSPVMDVGAPVISRDGSIVAGNGRFEGVSQAYNQGTEKEYLNALINDAQNKGIDPSVIQGMNKPVLVRRVTQPIDARKMAIASNIGAGLQYSALETAKIDSERMKGLDALDITDAGDIALTGQNITKLKDSLGDYNATEIASLVDKNGMLSQDGVRRVRNAMLASAYGGSETLGKLIESTSEDSRNILGALVRSAGSVAKVNKDIESGALPRELDITVDLLESVETLIQIKAKGQSVEQYFAQENLFGEGISQESQDILQELNNNIRSQKKMTAFIKSVYDGISRIDVTTADIFGEKVVPSKQEIIKGAKEQEPEQEDIFAEPVSPARKEVRREPGVDERDAKGDVGGKEGRVKFSKEAKKKPQAGITKQAAEQKLKDILGEKTAKVLLDSGVITLVDNAKDIKKTPGAKYITDTGIFDSKNGSKIHGLTFPDGRIVLVLNEITESSLDGVIKHEGFHSTVKNLVGEDTHAKLLDKLDKELRLSKGSSWIKDAYAAVPEGTHKDDILEEVAAYAIEQYANGVKQPGAIRRWVEAFLSAIRAAIIKSKDIPEALRLWAIRNLKPQDLANLAVAGLRARAFDQAQRTRLSKKDALPNTINIDGVERPTTNSDGKPIHPTEEGIRNFWEWFGDSEVVDGEGRPLVVYHGTTASFTEFDVDFANDEADLGGGFYFTNEPSDLEFNYAGFGPDLTAKIERKAEQIASETDREYDDPDVKEEARKMFSENEGFSMPVYLKMSSPVVMGGGNETYIEAGMPDFYEDAKQEIVNENPGSNADDLQDEIDERRDDLEAYWDGGTDEGIIGLQNALKNQGAEVYLEDMIYEGGRASDVISALKESEEILYAEGDSGELRGNEVIREAFGEIGYDGFIDNTVDVKFGSQRDIGAQMEGMDYDTVHYIAFNPSQIKSAIGNTGAFSKETADIRFSKETEGGLPPIQPDLPVETKARAAQRKIQDKFNRFTVINDWLRDQGQVLSERANVFAAEERFHSRVANQLEDFREELRNPLIERITDAGYSMGDIEDFLLAQHASEANAQVQKVRSDPDELAYGIADEQAAEYLEKVKPELRELANEFREITENTKNLLLENGIINQEIVGAWENTYGFYVPVKGGPESKAAKIGTGGGLKAKYKGKRRLGHGKRDEHVVENILADYERAVMTVEKNRVGKTLVMMAAEIQRDDLITIDKPEKRGVLKATTAYGVYDNGQLIDTFTSNALAKDFISKVEVKRKDLSPLKLTIDKITDSRVIYSASPMLADNELNVYIEGHAIRVQIVDDLLARAYGNMGAESLGYILSAGRALNGYLSKIYTGYSPEFIITNIVRDFTTGVINITGEEGAKFAAESVGNYAKSFGNLLIYAKTRKANEWIKRYRASGGNTGAAYLPDMERLGKEVETEVDSYRGVLANAKEGNLAGASRAAGRKAFKATVKWIEVVNQAGENAMRLAIFQAAVERGYSDNKAAGLAKNSTVNFNRKGEASGINAAYLFFNAAVQGTAATAHALTKGKHKHQAWGLTGGMATIGYLLAASMAGGDEDEYDKLSDYTKERNMVIKSGDGFVKIPVPYGYGFFWNFGRIMADAQRKDEWDKTPWRLAASAVEELTPFGSVIGEGDDQDSKQLLYALPTIFQMTGAPIVNLSGMGSPIMPESPFDKSQPDREKMWRGSKGTVYDVTAGWLDAMGMDVSPETLKHYTRSLTGGAGTFTASVAGMGMLAAEGVGVKDFEVKEIPFYRKGYTELTVSDTRRAYYEAVNEARSASEEYSRARRDRDLSKMSNIRAEKKELLALNKRANKLAKMISHKRDRQDAIKNDKKKSVKEQRLKLKELEREEERRYDKYLDVFKLKTVEMKARQKQ